MSIKSRLTTLEQFFASVPPIRLLMSDGRVEEIQPLAHEDALDFILRLANSPLSREAELICNAVAILEQPGHLVEVVQGFLAGHTRQQRPGFSDVAEERRGIQTSKLSPT